MAEPNMRIYLDYNASAPILPEVAAGMSEVLSLTGNPSSIHRDGRKIRSLIDDAREFVAGLVKSTPDSVTFTSGGTEANASAILGSIKSGVVSRALCSEVEHHSVLEHVAPSDRIPVNPDGILDLVALEERLKSIEAPVLVCVMIANNETGILQPIRDICEITHTHKGIVLCDSVQGPGKISIDVNELDVDFLTLSAHKIGGPQGVGALIQLSDTHLSPILVGGGQEKKRRSGTENSVGIVGFGIAAQHLSKFQHSDELLELHFRFEKALVDARSDARIVGNGSVRLPNTTCVSLPGVPSERQIMNLDLAGFSVSAGSACSSGKMEKSHVLMAMGLEAEVVNSAIRISFGHDTPWADLDRFVAYWASL